MSSLPWPLSALTRALVFAALLLFVASCGDDGTESGAATDEAAMTDDDMDHSDGDHGGHSHREPLEVPEGMAVPAISVTSEADSKSGHNIFVDLEDFAIAPESASTGPVDGEGHLHLYVDGERVMRFYNTAIHLDGLSAGEHEVMVEISANNHSAYAVDGEPIRAMTTITVDDDDVAGHGHGGGDLFESANPPEIVLEITEDPKSGHNLFIDVAAFTFAPENVGGEAVDGEGHLHLYVDGEQVGRLYGPWTHLALEPGTREIMVEASTNDHQVYGDDGEPVMAMATIEVMESDEMAMDDDDAMSDDNEEGHSHGGDGETLDMAAADADVVIEGTLEGGELTIDDRRFAVTEGQTVGVIFTSDETDEIHVHGYDILADIGPGETAELAFLADSAGTFEVEVEGSGRFLFEIQVG